MSLGAQSLQFFPVSARVSVLRARGLRIKGKDGTNDAYAALQAGREAFRTPVSEKRAEPVWGGDDAAFTFTLPPAAEGDGVPLQVRVLHRVPLGADKLLGLAVINVHELRENGARESQRWFKLLNKAGKADKERGEVLLDIQFLKSSMSVSMIDLSDKSHSRLGKIKDKIRGKKKDGLSDSASAILPSVTQVLTDSEGEMDGEMEGEPTKKKKNKLKSLFVPKSNMKRNSLSQSMSSLGTLPDKNSSISSSTSSGLNVDPEGKKKKKFTFLTHKRNSSSESKASNHSDFTHGSTNQNSPSQIDIRVNGSSVYREEPQSEEVQELEEEEDEEERERREEEEQDRREEKRRREAEEERKKEEEKEWIRREREREEQRKRMEVEERERIMEREKEEKRRKMEEEKERIRMEREEEEERRRVEEDEKERIRMEREIKEQRRRIEEEQKERIRIEREKEEQKRKMEEEEKERIRMAREKEEQKRKMEEEEKERIKMAREREEQRRRMEEDEKESIRMEREKEQRRKREEEEKERIRIEREKEEEQERRMEEEEQERRRTEKEEQRRTFEEEERTRIKREKEEQMRKLEEKRKEREAEELRIKMEEENDRKKVEEEKKKRIAEEERKKEEKIRAEKELEEKQKKVETERRLADEKKAKEEEERRIGEQKEKRRKEEERVRAEKEQKRAEMEKKRKEEEQRTNKEMEEQKKKEKQMIEQERLKKEDFFFEESVIPQSTDFTRSARISNVKPSMSVSAAVSQPTMTNINPFLDDNWDVGISENLISVGETTVKKGRAPLPPQLMGTGVSSKDVPKQNSYLKEVSKRPAPQPPDIVKMTREVTVEENTDQAGLGQGAKKTAERHHDSKVLSASQVDANPFTFDELLAVKPNKRPAPKPRSEISVPEDNPTSVGKKVTEDIIHLEEKASASNSKGSPPNRKLLKAPDFDLDVKVDLADDLSRKEQHLEDVAQPDIAKLNSPSFVKWDSGPEPLDHWTDGLPSMESSQKKSRAPLPPTKPKRTGDPSAPLQQPSVPNKSNLGQAKENHSNKRGQDNAPVSSIEIPAVNNPSSSTDLFSIFSPLAEKAQVTKPVETVSGSGSKIWPWAKVVPSDASEVREQVAPTSVSRQHAVKPLSAAENMPETFDFRVTENTQPKTK
ncbi:rab11 family-interacting protein 1-like, partial [Clarias magur]